MDLCHLRHVLIANRIEQQAPFDALGPALLIHSDDDRIVGVIVTNRHQRRFPQHFVPLRETNTTNGGAQIETTECDDGGDGVVVGEVEDVDEAFVLLVQATEVELVADFAELVT